MKLTRWTLLGFLALCVVIFHLYFEISLTIKLFFTPQVEGSGDLKYHEPLGLFAPVIYLFEGGIKVLEGLSPVVNAIREVLFFINSVLLVLSTMVSYFIFKRKIWAGIIIVLLSVPMMIVIFEIVSQRL